MSVNEGYYDTQCPECAAEGKDTACDNLRVYDSGKAFCVARHGNIDLEEQEEIEQPKLDPSMVSGHYSPLDKRGISKETCEKYGYQVNQEKKCHIANFYDSVGNVVMQKIRYPGKQFEIKGNSSYVNRFYGQHLFTPSDKVYITITEGELDCLSIAEVFNCRYPVVSVPSGAGSATKVVQENLEWLQGFSYVVLALDNDKDGKKATEECLKLLEPGKARVVTWPEGCKDASDLLKAGKNLELRSCIVSATEYIPPSVLTKDALVELLDDYKISTHKWPWEVANKTISHVINPCLYSIVAEPEVGKTKFIHELMYMYIQEGKNVGIVALEETRQNVLLKVTSSITGVDLCSVQNRKYTKEEKDLCRQVADHLAVYDHIRYGSSLFDIVNHVRYMVKVCKCPIIIFDNLSYSVTGEADERKAIDKAVKQLHDSTIKYEYTLINVGHLSPDDFADINTPPDVTKIRGSQGVRMYSDYIIGLTRDNLNSNKKARNTLNCWVLKDRPTGKDTGKTFKLCYNENNGRLEST